MRLFVDVLLPREVVAVLAAVSRPQHPGVRWLAPEHWHVTVQFLGEVCDVGGVAAALGRCRVGYMLWALARRRPCSGWSRGGPPVGGSCRFPWAGLTIWPRRPDRHCRAGPRRRSIRSPTMWCWPGLVARARQPGQGSQPPGGGGAGGCSLDGHRIGPGGVHPVGLRGTTPGGAQGALGAMPGPGGPPRGLPGRVPHPNACTNTRS